VRHATDLDAIRNRFGTASVSPRVEIACGRARVTRTSIVRGLSSRRGEPHRFQNAQKLRLHSRGSSCRLVEAIVPLPLLNAGATRDGAGERARLWPKISLSAISLGKAEPQSKRRLLCPRASTLVNRRSTSSLPVPLAPSTSTVTSSAIRVRGSPNTSRIATDSPKLAESRSNAPDNLANWSPRF